MIFGYKTLIHKSQHHQAARWCYETFGARWAAVEYGNGIGKATKSGVWACFWAGRDNFEYYNFHFHNEQDFTLFVLKWA